MKNISLLLASFALLCVAGISAVGVLGGRGVVAGGGVVAGRSGVGVARGGVAVRGARREMRRSEREEEGSTNPSSTGETQPAY